MMRLEHRQRAGLIKWCARLQAAQGIVSHEERDFESAVVAPKAHGMPRRVIAAALVCEVQRHVRPPLAGGSVVGITLSMSSCSYCACLLPVRRSTMHAHVGNPRWNGSQRWPAYLPFCSWSAVACWGRIGP